MKEYLRRSLKEHGYKYSKEPFTLKSGKKSHHYIDCRPVLLHQACIRPIAYLIRSYIHLFLGEIYGVAGVAIGACPLVDEVVSQQANDSMTQFWHKIYVRKEAKKHGTKNLVEMDFGVKSKLNENIEVKKKLPPGFPKIPGPKVVLLEDVWTTGGSARRAVKLLEEQGLEVCSVIALVDRMEEDVDDRPDFSLFTLKDIIS